MPETGFKVTSFQIGKVKSLFEEKGYGFITVAGKQGGFDLFFHYRNLRTPEIKEGDVVLFQTGDSPRHAGKLEGFNVIRLRDVEDFAILLQLYVKEGFIDLINQITTIDESAIKTVNLSRFLQEFIQYQFQGNNEKTDMLGARRLIGALKKQPNIPSEIKRIAFKRLLEVNDFVAKQLYFEVYKFFREDTGFSELSFNALELYKSLTPEQQLKNFENLTLAERLEIKPIGAVDSDEEFNELLSVIVSPGEDAGSNWRSISSQVILATRFQPLLWLEGIIADFPQTALTHHIQQYDPATQRSLLAKMSVDEQIRIFPFKEITNTQEYSLLKTFLSSLKDPVSGLKAFRIANIVLDSEFYIQSITDKFIPREEADIQMLGMAMGKMNLPDIRKLIFAVGWKIGLDLLKGAIPHDELFVLKLLVENSDFKKSDTPLLYQKISISAATAYQLWEQGLTETPPTAKLAAYFLQVADATIAEKLLTKTITFQRQLLQEALSQYLEDDGRQSEKTPLRLLAAVKKYSPEMVAEAVRVVHAKSSKWVHLYLWLYDHSTEFDFQDYAAYFITLSAADQKRFLKKCFFEMKNDPLSVSVDEVIRLKNTLLSPEQAREIDDNNPSVDFTVYVVLQAMEDLTANSVTKPEAMYKIIADQIRTPKELLVLEGFFDSCKGRLNVEKIGENDGNPVYHIKNERDNRPLDVLYCEGRKAVIIGTDERSLCERTGMEFWWCRNSKCYGSCVMTNELWQNYSLLDFLNIAGIKFKQQDYEILLGYINKVNKFLAHMTCRQCSHILKPAANNQGGNYGFYRVGGFSCQNPECEKQNEYIYLNHCINGRCGGVIDSRDSVKCRRPETVGEPKGWYVCQECLACCTTQGIERRDYILNATGQRYGGPLQGHKDLAKICCPKCGSEMNLESSNPGDYQRVLNWFLENRYRSSFVLNSGQRRDNKFWFIVRAPRWDAQKLEEFKRKLYRYIAIGFEVRDIRMEQDTYIISEPMGQNNPAATRVMTCPNGDYQLEVMSDYQRYHSMTKYHEHVVFPNFRNTEI